MDFTAWEREPPCSSIKDRISRTADRTPQIANREPLYTVSISVDTFQECTVPLSVDTFQELTADPWLLVLYP